MLGQVRPAQGIYKTSAQKLMEVGFRMPFNDGRAYVYSKAGAGLTVAHLAQAPTVETSNDVGLVVNVAGKAIDKQLSVTMVSAHASFVANAYAGGWLVIDGGDEVGLARQIKSHGAFTTGADATVVFKFRDALGVAVAVTTHTIKILANPYNGAIVNVCVTGSGSNTGRVLGVPVVDVPNGYYFWMLVQGIGPAINDNGAAYKAGTAATAAGTDVEVLTALGDPLIGHFATHSNDSDDACLVNFCCG